MNGKSLYQAIGNIDDDLIIEAEAAGSQKIYKVNFTFVRIAGIAACLCLILTAILFGTSTDYVYYNEAKAPVTSKLLVPSDENTTVITLDYNELFDYYGLTPFPDNFLELDRIEQKQFFLYQSPENEVYDTNILNYRSEDGAKTLTIMLKKLDLVEDKLEEDVKKSKIDGTSLVLGVANNTSEPVYWAEISFNNTAVRIVSCGVVESEFTALIREIIQYGK